MSIRPPRLIRLLVAACLFSSGLALAGPNAGGVMILSLNDFTLYCEDPPSYCVVIQEEDPLRSCADAVTNASPLGNVIFWSAYAAFPPGSSPRLAGVTFGVDYDNSTTVLLYTEPCGDFELPVNEWPAPNTGTAVTWGEARLDELVHVYVFAGYEYYGLDTSFDLIPNPNGGGAFADDDVPSNLDPIADYGRLGFNVDPGYLPCPAGVLVGACCASDGSCSVLTEGECADSGGTYLGDDTVCEPNPCDPVPVLESSWGRSREPTDRESEDRSG